MSNEEQAVISAYNLWKQGLMDIQQFLATLNKISGKAPSQTKPIVNQNAVTDGQLRYILRLQNEGKIPLNQSLDLTKIEAQALISNALAGKVEKDESIIPMSSLSNSAKMSMENLHPEMITKTEETDEDLKYAY